MKKNVLITGGGRGLGYAIAEKFIEQDCRVMILGRNENTLSSATDKLGVNSDSIVCDLSAIEEIPEVVRKIHEKMGFIDILINNAGIHLKKEILQVSDEEFQKIIQINQNSVFTISREVAKLMAQNKAGVILNISSMASQYGIPKVIAYTAAKSAIEGMTRAMAVELTPMGIRVNCIAPGFIKTEMSSKALDNDPERKAKVMGRTPMGRLGLPKEVADAAWFLCSEQASYISGVILPVDGGNSISF
ncbi:MAG TPA: SDR family oxidoreductase [Draconibacterium sp.]|nr:SDR family oxidoreductase [Draconibacterium sp.]